RICRSARAAATPTRHPHTRLYLARLRGDLAVRTHRSAPRDPLLRAPGGGSRTVVAGGPPSLTPAQRPADRSDPGKRPPRPERTAAFVAAGDAAEPGREPVVAGGGGDPRLAGCALADHDAHGRLGAAVSRAARRLAASGAG